MKQYALLHAVCGLAEGYSDTTVRFFSSIEEAVETKGKLVANLMNLSDAESCTTSTDGTESVITFDSDEREQEIVRVIPIKPTWPETPWVREYLIWNQMDCSLPFDGEYLPTEMAVLKDLCERLEAVTDEVSIEPLGEFINDMFYGRQVMFDADDICIYYFQVPKPTQQ